MAADDSFIRPHVLLKHMSDHIISVLAELECYLVPECVVLFSTFHSKYQSQVMQCENFVMRKTCSLWSITLQRLGLSSEETLQS